MIIYFQNMTVNQRNNGTWTLSLLSKKGKKHTIDGIRILENAMKKISVEAARPGMQLSRPVVDGGGKTLLESCLLLNDDYLEKLRAAGIKDVYVIETEDLDETVSAWDDLLEKGFKETKRRTLDAARNFLDHVARGETGPEDNVGKTIIEVMENLLSDNNILVKLAGIRAVDNYLYSHSVNTAVMAMLIAMKLDHEEKTLLEIGKSALMADVGMMLIPAATFEHKGALSDDQRKTVEKHVEHSKQILSEIPNLLGEVVEAVFQHHERVDGKGYPKGLGGDDILPQAKIIAIADVFAAIREPRVYREKSGPVRALKSITRNRGFDPEIMRRFLATVSVYPVQSIVLLNNGAVGSVVTVRENNPFRPVIEILKGEDGQRPSEHSRLDLMEEENLHLYILEALDTVPPIA